MLTIRLTRKGKKNQPFFRIVVIDKKRSAKGGRAVEELGYVNPLTKKNSINKERALYWLGVGAQPSPRIHNLFITEKIVDAPKINLFKKSKKAAEAAAAPAAQEASAPEAPKAEPRSEAEASTTGEEPKPEAPATPETPAQA